MLPVSGKKSLLFLAVSTTFVISLTILIILYARGYQISLSQKPSLVATGLLSVTSRPKSASVYINNRLITATDDTINLPPGVYPVKIVKDGYLPWQKTITIRREVVFQTDAQLYRLAPELRPITLTGAINPVISPDNTKIIYSVASASASRDNGLYLIELSNMPLTLNRNTPRQISAGYSSVDWSKFTFEFSPNSKQILATSKTPNLAFLLNLDSPITSSSLYDVTIRLSIIRQDWQKQLKDILDVRTERLPLALKPLVATDSARHFFFSPQDDRVLYLAKTDGNLKNSLATPPPAQSTQTQSRQVQKDNYYVYDLKEDTNFFIGKSQDISNPFWIPGSNTIVFTKNNQIQAVESDGTNSVTLYAGNFNQDVVYPSTDGNRLITLTSPYPGSPENLYSITIR